MIAKHSMIIKHELERKDANKFSYGQKYLFDARVFHF